MCCNGGGLHRWGWWETKGSGKLYADMDCGADAVFLSLLKLDRLVRWDNIRVYSMSDLTEEKRLVLMATLKLKGLWNENVL